MSGLGLFPLTFDWAQIAYIGSPLLTPWWAAANVVGGLVIVMWILAPIMCMSPYYFDLHMTYMLTGIRLQQRTLLRIPAHTIVCSL